MFANSQKKSFNMVFCILGYYTAMKMARGGFLGKKNSAKSLYWLVMPLVSKEPQFFRNLGQEYDLPMEEAVSGLQVCWMTKEVHPLFQH